MTRDLPTTNNGSDWIQYRGNENTAMSDDFGVVFTTSKKNAWNIVVHDPKPVVDNDAEDPPPDAVERRVADALVQRCPVVAFGVVCEYPTGTGDGHDPSLEIDGKVMESPKAADGRAAKFTGGSNSDPPDGTDDTDDTDKSTDKQATSNGET